MVGATSTRSSRRSDSPSLIPLSVFFLLLVFQAATAVADPDLVSVLLEDRRSAVVILRDGIEHRFSARSSLPHRVLPGVEGILAMNGRRWRGELIVERSGRGGLRVLNRLPLEDYLKGVVPCEMPAAWPIEALKAQAVAARSYALGRLRRHAAFADRATATLQATVADQVYRGASAEMDTSNRAVEETAGEFLEFEGAPVTAYFHAACGGVAERPAEIWRNHVAVDERWIAASAAIFGNATDTWCAGSPHQTWRFVLSRRELLAALRHLAPLRTLERFEVHDRTLSGRVARFAATGRTAAGEKTTRLIDGQRFRMVVGPERIRSLLGDLFPDGDHFVFFGRGWGHGAGLCQWGARARAEAGQSYEEILAAYYPGARLVRVEEFIGGDPPATDSAPFETVLFPGE